MVNIKSKHDQEYMKHMLDLLHNDPENLELNHSVKILLQKVTVVEGEIHNLLEQIKDINNEISNKQINISDLNKEIIFKQGVNQGMIDALLSIEAKGDDIK